MADGIGCPFEPSFAFVCLLRGQEVESARTEHIELIGGEDVLVKLRGEVLGDDEDLVDVGIEGVREGDVDQSIAASKGDGWLAAHRSKGMQPGSLSTGQDNGGDFLEKVITLFLAD